TGAGTGTGMSFALAGFESTDGHGQGSGNSAGASWDGTGGKDDLASSKIKASASSSDGGIGPREGSFYTTGTPSDPVNLINLVVLLIGFLAIVILIWHAFQRVLKESNNKRERSKWQVDKEAKSNARNLKVFGRAG
ncbi:MAG: hypothetical protein V3T46_07280, partial [Alphaproteobacteria bacterium]